MTYKNIAVLMAAVAASTSALATDGYFSHGYGMRAKGMGGAATAMAEDSFGGANNPASMVWVGNRLDVGIDWFSPKRDATRSGSVGTGLDGSASSGSTNFFIPEFGYNRMLNSNMSIGVTVYGNGGMNTDYPGGQLSATTSACPGFNVNAGPYNLLCGTGRLGVDLMQLIIAPTFAMKINSDHSIGISPLLGYQRFKAEGLDGFFGFTPNPAGWPGNNSLTNRGYDTSTGWGVRIGWMGRVTNTITLGAAYATRMKMSKFDKYKDLFPEQGAFDLPENMNVGISFKPANDWTIAADYQRINYGKIKSISNPSTNTGNSTAGTGFTMGSLGCNDCRGFGWDNVDVLKLGVEYQLNKAWLLRAGYNHTSSPIQSRDVTFNILAPGVIKDHLTLGFTYSLDPQSDITMAYMHAFRASVSGSSLFNNFMPPGASAGNEKIQMYQNSLGIAYSRKL